MRKSKSCGHAHLHYVYKHPAKYESCSSKTVGGVSRTNHVPFMQLVRKNDQVQLPVILRIFEENQNPVVLICQQA
jgi:hypothetical protein